MDKENKSSQKIIQDELPCKIRFKFSKTGPYKYFSHLDIISIISRAIRRAKIKVKYSEGFNPKPKMSFGPPTSLGIESLAEYGDITLTGDLEPEDFLMRLNDALQDKIIIEKAVRIEHPVKSIMSQTDIIKYSISLDPGKSIKKKEDILNNLRSLLSDKNGLQSRGVYRFEEIENKDNSSLVVLNLFGYAKILKNKESKVFKFGDFRISMEGICEEHGIENMMIIKEELYIINGERLATPIEILQ